MTFQASSPHSKISRTYYEYEGEDKELGEEEESIRTKKLRLKYKPNDFKEIHSTPTTILYPSIPFYNSKTILTDNPNEQQ